jgi:hypothetical protein
MITGPSLPPKDSIVDFSLLVPALYRASNNLPTSPLFKENVIDLESCQKQIEDLMHGYLAKIDQVKSHYTLEKNAKTYLSQRLRSHSTMLQTDMMVPIIETYFQEVLFHDDSVNITTKLQSLHAIINVLPLPHIYNIYEQIEQRHCPFYVPNLRNHHERKRTPKEEEMCAHNATQLFIDEFIFQLLQGWNGVIFQGIPRQEMGALIEKIHQKNNKFHLDNLHLLERYSSLANQGYLPLPLKKSFFK